MTYMAPIPEVMAPTQVAESNPQGGKENASLKKQTQLGFRQDKAASAPKGRKKTPKLPPIEKRQCLHTPKRGRTNPNNKYKEEGGGATGVVRTEKGPGEATPRRESNLSASSVWASPQGRMDDEANQK
jgi:hypothetical protein